MNNPPLREKQDVPEVINMKAARFAKRYFHNIKLYRLRRWSHAVQKFAHRDPQGGALALINTGKTINPSILGAGFNLDKNQHAPMPCHNIQLVPTGAPVAHQNEVSGSPQVAGGAPLPAAANRPPAAPP